MLGQSINIRGLPVHGMPRLAQYVTFIGLPIQVLYWFYKLGPIQKNKWVTNTLLYIGMPILAQCPITNGLPI